MFPYESNDIIFDIALSCRCGWSGDRSELRKTRDIEITHPKNKNNPNCTMENKWGCHYTKFEECRECGKIFFADDRMVWNGWPLNNL